MCLIVQSVMELLVAVRMRGLMNHYLSIPMLNVMLKGSRYKKWYNILTASVTSTTFSDPKFIDSF